MKSSLSANLHRSASVLTLALIVSGTSGAMLGQAATAPDNSKQNAHQTRTADNQSNAAGDRQTTAQVRRAIIADKSLSMYAHNVKILVAGGQVTLKGPVHSDEEKQKVEADAATVVGADKITNKLTVK